MPLNLRGSEKFTDFNKPVSFRIYDRKGNFLDARNVQSVQDRLDTRHGTTRLNDTSLGGKVLSISHFVKSDGNRYTIAKIGTDLKLVSITGAHTVIKSGLSATTVHRGVTTNNRHIILIENDGMFSYDGTTFTQLGQDPPATVSAVAAAGGSLTSGTVYRAAITYYASSIGFETNYKLSGDVTVSGSNLKVTLSSIPATAANALVDKVRIYLKDVTANGPYLFIDEINLGITSYAISKESLSSQEPPLDNGSPLPGGGKYPGIFNSKLTYCGNENFPNDFFFSEEYLPDAFNPNDSQIVLSITGQGGLTGHGTGMFSDTHLSPFIAIFKRKSTHIYSEISGSSDLVCISNEIGCVSHDTIREKNGVIYFLSDEGFRAIANGKFVTNAQGEAVTLGQGNIDDIFKTSGYTFEVNRTALTKSFSVYYPTLDQYMTWVAEGTNDKYTKTYVYEFDVGGFKPWEFYLAATCATLAENGLARGQVLLGTEDGYILKHSIMEEKSDVDENNLLVPINAYAILPWMPENGDFDATYNYRELILRAIPSTAPLTVKSFVDFNLASSQDGTVDFQGTDSGFILDDSFLDVDSFGDERAITTARTDINRVGESIAIGFYQAGLNANIGLVSMQIDSSKNGNRNPSQDVSLDEGGFEDETSTAYPAPSVSAINAANSATTAGLSAAAAVVSKNAAAASAVAAAASELAAGVSNISAQAHATAANNSAADSSDYAADSAISAAAALVSQNAAAASAASIAAAVTELANHESRITSLEAPSDVHYFGSSTVDGSWRIFKSGTNLLIQVRASGSWTTISEFAP